MGVDPVAVLHRDDLIFIQQLKPLIYPLVCGVRISVDMGVSKDLKAMGSMAYISSKQSSRFFVMPYSAE